MRAFEIEEGIDEIISLLNNLKVFASCQKSFDDVNEYLEFINSKDFHSSASTIAHKKMRIIELISKL